MRQKGKAVREKEPFCWWRTALMSHRRADGPCCCSSGHMPREQQQQSNGVGAMRRVTGTCACVFVSAE